MIAMADRRSERAADELDFERILAEHLPAVSRLARSFTNSESDRQDLLQEIAIALWKALAHFRGECSERTFLFRIAHNRAADWLSLIRPLQPRQISICPIHLLEQKRNWCGASAWGDCSTRSAGCPQDSGKR